MSCSAVVVLIKYRPHTNLIIIKYKLWLKRLASCSAVVVLIKYRPHTNLIIIKYKLWLKGLASCSAVVVLIKYRPHILPSYSIILQYRVTNTPILCVQDWYQQNYLQIWIPYIYPNRSRAHINVWAQINTRFSTLKEISAHVNCKRGSYKCLVNNHLAIYRN